MVRIQDSQSWHRGSIPLSTTKCFHVLVIVGKLAFSLYDYCKLFFCLKAGKTGIQQSSKHLDKKSKGKIWWNQKKISTFAIAFENNACDSETEFNRKVG